MKEKYGKKGFTLVELIVVLVILTILAVIMVPALTSWIGKANEKKVLLEARTVVLAAQTTASEGYAKQKDLSLTDDTEGEVLALAKCEGDIRGWTFDDGNLLTWLEYVTADGTFVTYCTEYEKYPLLTGVYTIGAQIGQEGNEGESQEKPTEGTNESTGNTNSSTAGPIEVTMSENAEKLPTNWKNFFSEGWKRGFSEGYVHYYKQFEQDGETCTLVFTDGKATNAKVENMYGSNTIIVDKEVNTIVTWSAEAVSTQFLDLLGPINETDEETKIVKSIQYKITADSMEITGFESKTNKKK